ncbi:flagellar hook-length control protein FliK [Pseudohaliea sp.]|uniref:flagellar hook-length control protein FliK n=1 Tax=Pseudohaliea sp. TaxID=2740289 RepID=UPI0032EC24A6
MLTQLPLAVGPAVSTGESVAADSVAPQRPAGEAPADPFAGLLAGLRVAAGTQASAGGKGLPSDGSPLPLAEGPPEALVITAPVAGPLAPGAAAGLSAEPAPISPAGARLAATPPAAPGLSIALTAARASNGAVTGPATGAAAGAKGIEGPMAARPPAGQSLPQAGPWPGAPALPAADGRGAVTLPAGAAPAAEGEPRIPVPFTATGAGTGEADSAGARPGIRPAAAAADVPDVPQAPVPSASPAARDLMAAAAEPPDADTRRPPLPGGPVAAAQGGDSVAAQRADAAALPALSQLSTDGGASPRPTALAYNLAGPQGDFAEGLAGQVRILVGTASREATMQLHPAELGRLHVTINTDGDQARVVFVTDTAHARDAIEQSLPRLRELLQQSGLDLAEGDVSYREPQQQARGDGGERDGLPGTPGGSDPAGLTAEAPEGQTSGTLALRVDGLLDTFA